MNYQQDTADIETALIKLTPFSYTLDLRFIIHSIPRITWIRYSYYTLHKLQDRIKKPLSQFDVLLIGYCRYGNSLNYTDKFLVHFRFTDYRAYDPTNYIDQVQLLHLNNLWDKIKIPRLHCSMNYQQDTADIAYALITPTPFLYTLDLRIIGYSIPRMTQIRYRYYTLHKLQDQIKIPRYHRSMNYQQDTVDIATALISTTFFSHTLY